MYGVIFGKEKMLTCDEYMWESDLGKFLTELKFFKYKKSNVLDTFKNIFLKVFYIKNILLQALR